MANFRLTTLPTGGTIGHRSDPMGLHVHTDQQEDHPHARELASETGGGETTSKPVSVDEDMQSRSRSIQFLQVLYVCVCYCNMTCIYFYYYTIHITAHQSLQYTLFPAYLCV